MLRWAYEPEKRPSRNASRRRRRPAFAAVARIPRALKALRRPRVLSRPLLAELTALVEEDRSMARSLGRHRFLDTIHGYTAQYLFTERVFGAAARAAGLRMRHSARAPSILFAHLVADSDRDGDASSVQ